MYEFIIKIVSLYIYVFLFLFVILFFLVYKIDDVSSSFSSFQKLHLLLKNECVDDKSKISVMNDEHSPKRSKNTSI